MRDTLHRWIVFMFTAAYCLLAFAGSGQQPLWQQQLHYAVQVQLNPADHSLLGEFTLRYKNNSPDTLSAIPFRLAPNAYKNDRTAYSEYLLGKRDTRFYFSGGQDKGYIDSLDFMVDGAPATLEVDSIAADRALLLLNRFLLPGDSVTIASPFFVKLPTAFSGNGVSGRSFLLAQWLPVPAVYDRKGWHPSSFTQNEYTYTDPATFDVQIVVPPNYSVVAPGTEIKTTLTGTRQFVANNLGDFAWLASPRLPELHEKLAGASGMVDISVYGSNNYEARRALTFAAEAIRFYEKKAGAYPYAQLRLVLSPDIHSLSFYPGVVWLPSGLGDPQLDAAVAEGVAYNCFAAAQSADVYCHPWMGAGIRNYYLKDYLLKKYGSDTLLSQDYKIGPLPSKNPADDEHWLASVYKGFKKAQPLDTPADSLWGNNALLNWQVFTPDALSRIEKEKGSANFEAAMQQYFQQWQFKHPYPEDFRSALDMDTVFWQKINQPGSAKDAHKTLKPAFLYDFKETEKYNYLSFAPAIGFNNYDKFMAGLLIHNYQLPQQAFSFALAPMYATGSKRFAGAGRMEYNIWNARSSWQFGLHGETYSRSALKVEPYPHLYQRLVRLVPEINYTVYPLGGQPNRRWQFGVRSFFLKEEAYSFQRNPGDTAYTAYNIGSHTTLLQANAHFSDNRELYPYSGDITLDGGSHFLRAGFTGKYFFNYGTSPKGVEARFFAGKFFYLGTQTTATETATSRYRLQLGGPIGSYDYTYSNYFIGRNETDGWMSQQIMERDGFFKIKTPYASGAQVGISDNWLSALNLTADVPDKYNPFSVLPFKIPLKLFLDIGTFSDAWQDDAVTDRFLYDAGFQLSFAHSLVNIYIPVVYSGIYRDAFKSVNPKGYFWRTLSFNINLQALQPRRLAKSWWPL